MATECAAEPGTTPTTPATPAALTTPTIRGLLKRWKRRCGGDVGAGLPLLARVFAARGLSDSAACEAFLSPTLRQLHDPSLMPNLDRAAERVFAAAKAGEPIVIYGDYDVDGITATAILYHTLKAITPECKLQTYVPHRLEEGYGLNSEAITELAAGGAKVIVSVDCGITAAGPAMVARAASVDLIVTDHHNMPGDGAFPDAYALVHPRLPGSAYPFGELCGAGVAYKLAWRLCTLACGSQRVSEPLRELLVELLALTSLGVIADIVPLVGENRVIAYHGLRRIKHSRIEGLRALVEASGLAGENVGEEDVGFKLGPRLNACGRMGHAREAVELLTTATGARAVEIAEELTRKNEERRRVERQIFEQACQMVEWEGMHRDDRRAIVLSHADWNPGVVGIVCSRLVERFGRPTILMREHDGECHGSGRSIDGFSLHAGLEHCGGYLKSFGGHDMAAGLKLEARRMREFVEAFIAHANERIAVDELIGSIGYDGDAAIEELTTPAVKQLTRLAPFGRENPSIRLRIPGARVAGRAQTMGKNNKHLVMQLASSAGSMKWLRVVGWNWADRIAEVPAGRVVDALVAPKLNEWQGTARVEAELIDLRPAE